MTEVLTHLIKQNTDMQKKALKKAGCEKVFVDQVSGTVAKRPGLEKAKELLRNGDTLVVWRLDRLGRSLHGCAILMKRELAVKASMNP